MFCKECKEKGKYTEMIQITEIVTSANERFHVWEFETGILFQCPECKDIVID